MVIKVSKLNVTVLLVALSVFLVNYEFPIIHVNVTTVFYLILALIMLIKVLFSNNSHYFRKIKTKFVLYPLYVIFLLYLLIETFYVGSTNGIISTLIQIFLLYFQLFGLMMLFGNDEAREIFKRCVCRITMLMSAIVYIQCFLFYVYGFLPGGDVRQALIPFKVLFTSSVALTSSQGTMVIEGLFRPSALFLEPAHFAAYCIFGLIFYIFGTKKIDWKAIFISIAIFLTTSGIGIGSVVLVWAAYFFLNFKSMETKKLVIGFWVVVCIVVVFFILYSNFSFFSDVFDRLRGNNSALIGRLSGYKFVRQLTGTSRLFGMGYKNIPTYGLMNNSYYFSAIIELLYCQGVIGTIIFIALYIYGAFKTYKADNYQNFVIMLLGIVYIIGTGLLGPSQLSKFIPCMFI